MSDPKCAFSWSSTLSEYDQNRVQYWRPVYTLLFEFENGNSTSVAQKQKLIRFFFLFGEFDFVRLPNSIELNPRIEFD